MIRKQQSNGRIIGLYRRPDMRWVVSNSNSEGVLKSMTVTPLTLEQRFRLIYRYGLMGAYKYAFTHRGR